MRAVKTVITAAGNLKREQMELEEDQICLRALKDVNVPKFLKDDLKLFKGKSFFNLIFSFKLQYFNKLYIEITY